MAARAWHTNARRRCALRGIFGQLRIVQPAGDVQQAAADVAGNDVENVGGTRREAFDTQALVDKDRGNVGGGDEVLQVVVDLGGFFHLGLQFVTDGGQFLVD